MTASFEDFVRHSLLEITARLKQLEQNQHFADPDNTERYQQATLVNWGDFRFQGYWRWTVAEAVWPRVESALRVSAMKYAIYERTRSELYILTNPAKDGDEPPAALYNELFRIGVKDGWPPELEERMDSIA